MLLLLANLSAILFYATVFQGNSQSFLISTFCTNFVFLNSKKFQVLVLSGLKDMLSANQNAESFVCIFLRKKLWCYVSGKVKHKNLVSSKELLIVELPP